MFVSRCESDKDTRQRGFKYNTTLEKNKLFVKGEMLSLLSVCKLCLLCISLLALVISALSFSMNCVNA